jgi:hypothetical protein
VDALYRLSIDIAAMGNHEYDYFRAILAHAINDSPIAYAIAKPTAEEATLPFDIWMRKRIARDNVKTAIQFAGQRRIGFAIPAQGFVRQYYLKHCGVPCATEPSCPKPPAVPPWLAPS